jgi:hypothetical protein
LACYKAIKVGVAGTRAESRMPGSNQMTRFGAGIATWVVLGLLLCGCSSTGNSGLFSTSPLDMFHQSSKATTGGTASTGPVIDSQYDCPEVKVRYGAATLMVGDKPGQGEPNALDVKYQGSILRTARECHLAGNIMTMKVGIEGRVITGPAGSPGNVDVPLRIAVTDISQYVVYVGFDPLGAQMQKKPEVHKKRRRVRPKSQPRSS